MAIREHPAPGTILVCDFNQGFREPEMVKRRPVVVISPKIGLRPRLCTVVSLSTKAPLHRMPYNCEIIVEPKLPPPWDADAMWVKGDMIYAVGFHRLDLIRINKDETGKRIYLFDTITTEQMKAIRKCVLCSLGMTSLTRHL